MPEVNAKKRKESRCPADDCARVDPAVLSGGRSRIHEILLEQTRDKSGVFLGSRPVVENVPERGAQQPGSQENHTGAKVIVGTGDPGRPRPRGRPRKGARMTRKESVSVSSLHGKLADCQEKDPAKSERSSSRVWFDSAGGRAPSSHATANSSR